MIVLYNEAERKMYVKSAITVTIGVQKGGSGKTTTTGILAYLLSQKGYKVLAIDMDSQGNLTEMLTGVEDIYVFQGNTIMDAVKEGLKEDHIYSISENLHIIPSTDLLAMYSTYVTTVKERSRAAIDWNLVLGRTLAPIMNRYDFILIDTPPALSEQTLNSMAISDYIITMFETSKFCLSAIPRYFETYLHIKEKVNPHAKMLGIVRTLTDSRRIDNKLLIDQVDEMVEGVCFDTVINRTASIGRISLLGFLGNDELKKSLIGYEVLLDEILERMVEEKEYFEKIDEVIKECLIKDYNRLTQLKAQMYGSDEVLVIEGSEVN